VPFWSRIHYLVWSKVGGLNSMEQNKENYMFFINKSEGVKIRRTHFRRMIALAIACIMLSIAIVPIASVSGGSYVIATQLENVDFQQVFWLDLEDFSRKASQGKELSLDVSAFNLTFTLYPVRIFDNDVQVIGPDGNRDVLAEEQLMNTRTYKGTSLIDGLENIRMTITPHWMQLSFEFEGQDYFIEAIDGSGVSGFYALYSTEDIQLDTSIDLSNDIVYPQEFSSEIYETTNILSNNTETVIYYDEIDTQVQPQIEDLSSSEKLSSGFKESKKNISSCKSGDPEYRVCRIILAADYELWHDRYPSDWPARLTSTLNTMAEKYESEVSITFKIVQYWAIPSSYCRSTDPQDLLDDFYIYMNLYVSAIRDVAHLCSGKDLDGSEIGKAYEPGVGTSKWTSSDYAYSISEQYYGSSHRKSWIMGHELGHNLNGDHQYAVWFIWPPLSIKSWMYPGYSGSSEMDFTADNTERIKSWADQTLDIGMSINPGPSSTSPDGLKSSDLFLRDYDGGIFYHPVGTTVEVGFTITNTKSYTITLQYLFVGARDASNNNRDFGHISNFVLDPYEVYEYSTSFTPQSGGTWTLWPAYKYQGHWGPYKWITIQPTMHYLQGEKTGKFLSNDAPYFYYNDNVWLFYRFCVLSTVQTLTVGSTVWVYFTLYNGNSGTSTNTFANFFVGCRDDSVNRDFGYQGSTTLTQKGDSYIGGGVGGGCTVFESRTLSSSGTWEFWPAYSYNGHWGPYKWQEIILYI